MNKIDDQSERYLTQREAARYANCSESWLRALRLKGSTSRVKAPAYIRIGRCIRYRISDLEEWIESHRVSR